MTTILVIFIMLLAVTVPLMIKIWIINFLLTKISQNISNSISNAYQKVRDDFADNKDSD